MTELATLEPPKSLKEALAEARIEAWLPAEVSEGGDVQPGLWTDKELEIVINYREETPVLASKVEISACPRRWLQTAINRKIV